MNTKLIAEIEAVQAERLKLSKQSEVLYKKLEALTHEYTTEISKTLIITPKVVINGYPGFNCSIGFADDVYKKVEEFFKQYKYVRSRGYHPKAEVNGLQITLPYNMSADDIKKAVKELNDFLPEMPNDLTDDINRFPGLKEPLKTVDIFEHTLSAGGCYTLGIGKNNCYILLMRYHRGSVDKTFKTLEQALQYITKIHWYGGKDEYMPDNDDYES